jgi:uncharacterized protein YceH (UPF0502 family)
MEQLTPEEIRVVGSLAEKQLTTPDNYPLTQNALIAACNQLSNRQPVVSYDDNTVRLTLTSLRAKQLARVVHIPGSRAPKHRHVLDETLELDRGELALVTVLLLRGPQTVGELRTRTERMHTFASLAEVEETLERLAERAEELEPLVVRMERQPGQKEARYAHLLGGPVAAEAWPEEAHAPAPTTPAPGATARSDRFAALEERLAAVEAGLADLRHSLGLGAGEAEEE